MKEYTYGNATIVIHRPELNEKELKRIEAQILISLQQIGKELKENE
jgi:hypothetical protein